MEAGKGYPRLEDVGYLSKPTVGSTLSTDTMIHLGAWEETAVGEYHCQKRYRRFFHTRYFLPKIFQRSGNTFISPHTKTSQGKENSCLGNGRLA